MKKLIIFIGLFAFLIQWGMANDAEITRVSGDVKVRRGVEEKWTSVAVGILLENIDTILTGENGEVVLQTKEGMSFHLGPNAVLDIADLRKITERDLHLFLVKQKVDRIEPRSGKMPLRVGNVSVVHGESKDTIGGTDIGLADFISFDRLRNGVRALHDQEYYPNVIVKVHKILKSGYPEDDCGELYYYLGSSFESLNKSGQALDAYRTVIQKSAAETCGHQKWMVKAKTGMERIEQ